MGTIPAVWVRFDKFGDQIQTRPIEKELQCNLWLCFFERKYVSVLPLLHPQNPATV